MKMQKKIKISMAVVAALMLAVLAVNLVMGATSVSNTLAPEANNIETIEKVETDDIIIISPEQTEDKEQLKELAPETFEEAERSIYPVRRRFILWTEDGLHVMWGVYGNGRFAGTDNLGKRCWGIYGKGVFAGFYDGDFFWGKYCNAAWNANYLFGLDSSRGEYVLFPPPAITIDAAP
jgi:hypothetical protein